ncbi:hypothetical protein DSO57_1022720 [Entomophthora muscae]|uniref:Uncharacterized protein n=1 Tax=Entomophthora muscae TaxID=34485 RepID=A0ACC2RHN0_9FUNG|nr:hypothetical protein DSO57_1022720 [Entomophthora muscae]
MAAAAKSTNTRPETTLFRSNIPTPSCKHKPPKNLPNIPPTLAHRKYYIVAANHPLPHELNRANQKYPYPCQPSFHPGDKKGNASISPDAAYRPIPSRHAANLPKEPKMSHPIKQSIQDFSKLC